MCRGSRGGVSCRKVSCCVLASTPGFQAPDRSSRRGDGVLAGLGLLGPVKLDPRGTAPRLGPLCALAARIRRPQPIVVAARHRSS
jgi:hypothetical protein